MDKGMKVAALTVLRDAIDAQLETARAELHEELLTLARAYSVKSIEVSSDNHAIASATLSDRQAAYVLNRKTFQKWVEENYPAFIETTIAPNPEWVKSFLGSLEMAGEEAVDPSTGEIVDGVVFPPVKKILTVRFKADGRERVAGLFRSGQATLEDLMNETPALESE